MKRTERLSAALLLIASGAVLLLIVWLLVDALLGPIG